MNRQLIVVLAMVAVLISGTALAQTEKMPIAGTSSDVGRVVLTPGVVSPDFYSFTLSSLVVYFDTNPGWPGVKAVKDTSKDPARAGKTQWELRFSDNPQTFAQSTVYAIYLGTDYLGEGKTIDKVKVNEKTPFGNIDANGNATFSQIPHNEKYAGIAYWQRLTWLVIFPGGQRAWGGQPGGWWVFNNTRTEHTAIGVGLNELIKPNAGIKAEFAKMP